MNPISRAFFFPVFAIRSSVNLRNALLLWLIFAFLLDATLHSMRAATVSWVGQGGDWSTAANWSTGALPGPLDDVVIPAGSSITVTHSTGADTVDSIICHQAFTLSGGSLSVANTFQTDGPLNLSGGDLINAIVQENGGSLVVSSGTLDGVTIDGTLDLGTTVNNASLMVTNGLTLNGTMQVGGPSTVGSASFTGSQVLGGNGAVVFGPTGPINTLIVAYAGTTLVIGSGITVHGQNGCIGYYPGWGLGSPDASVANQGTISADVSGGTITIEGGSFNNEGTIEAQNGGTLSVDDMAGNVGQTSLGAGSTLSLNGAYTNDLTLNIPANAALNLSGTWGNAGSINANQGTVNLSGTWNNGGEIQATGGAMTLGPSWVNSVTGGVIQASGGTINLEGVFTVSTVELLQLGSGENVNINGTLDNTNTTLVLNGAVATWTLAGGMIAGGTVVTTNGGSLLVSSGTLDGVTVNGTLDLSYYFGASLTVLDGLTLNGTMLVGPQGGDAGAPGAVYFSGSQALSGNGLVVFGPDTQNGIDGLSVADEGTTLVIGPGVTVGGVYGGLSVAGGASLVNQGTISADSGGTIRITGGNFENEGTLGAGNGGLLSVQDLAGSVGQVSLSTGGTLSLNGTYTNNLTLNVPSSAVLNLSGTWANTGSINANQGTLNLTAPWPNGGRILATGGVLSLAGSFNLAMVQTLQIGSGENVNINGTLDNTSTTLVVAGTSVSWSLTGGTIVGGTVVTTNGGALEVYSGTLDGVTVDGAVDVGSSGIGASLTVLDGLTLNGTMLVGPQGGDAGAPGAVYFSGSQGLSGNGLVVFGPDTQNGIDGLSVADEGTTLVIGPGVTVGGVYGGLSVAGGASLVNQGTISADNGGTIRITGGSFSNEGLLEATNGGVIQPSSSPIINSGTIVIDSGAMTFANSFTQTTGTLDFGLNSPTDFGQITFSGSATLGGTLAAHLNAGFQATIGDSFALLNYGNDNPSFTNLSFPPGYAWQTNASNGSLTLAVQGILPYSVTISPTNSIVAVGSSLTLTAMATGPGPFTFQWSQNGSNIAGATSTNLVLTNLSKSATGVYIITVSNTGASLPSAPVQLLVLAPPVVVTPPPSQTAAVGSAVELNVTVSGDQPLAYQWLFKGANLAGATNSTLSFNDVTRSEAGSYVVVASNPVGVATSAPPALFTVTTPPICPSAPSGMVAWWPGNGDTSDYAGTNDAVFEGTAAYASGEVGEAFSFDGFSSYLEVPDSSLWDFGTNDFSCEFWANFSLIVPSLAVGDESIVFLAHDQESGTRNKWLFGFGAGDLYFYIDGAGIGPKFLAQAAFNPQTNQWYHLGLTKTSGVYQIYVNGSQISAATNNLSIPQANAPLTIGEAQGLFMSGMMDEISIYDRALKSSEILAIYEAGSQGKCPGGQSSQPLTIGPAGFNSTGQYQFQILGGQAGAAIQVQASPDLAHWTNIWQTTMTNGGESFTDPDSIHPLRFYRANSTQ